MPESFVAQSLVATRANNDDNRFEMTFVDAAGQRQTISLPVGVAGDLVPVLQSLVSGLSRSDRVQFTRIPKLTAVGSARHERLVLIRFDDEPPYGLDPDGAENLWREVREATENVSRSKVQMRQ